MALLETPCGITVKIDDEMVPVVERYALSAKKGRNKEIYIYATIPLHRLVMGTSGAEVIDHKDRDPMNNQISNLRVCTVSQNNSNRAKRLDSGLRFKGIKKNGKGFSARIRKDTKRHHLGTFSTDTEAAMAYDKAAIEMHGPFAVTNASLGLLPLE